MNAKKAKALRLSARQMVLHHNKTAAEKDKIPERQHNTMNKTAKNVFVDEKDENGNVSVKKVNIFDGQIVNSPRSQRSVYHQLKKMETKNG